MIRYLLTLLTLDIRIRLILLQENQTQKYSFLHVVPIFVMRVRNYCQLCFVIFCHEIKILYLQ